MTKTELDFSFDQRVSDSYDVIRAHPDSVSPQIGDAICALVGAGGRVLELGVGTGRIAIPVAAAGCEVVGVDLSHHMLRHVVDHAAQANLSLSAVQADVSRLPIQPQSFDAVTAVHVLHLVPNWEAALAGAAASLKPGGTFILGRDWTDPATMAGQIQNAFRRTVVEIMGPALKAPTAPQVIAETLMSFGADAVHLGDRDLVAAEWTIALSPVEIISSIRERTYPESWVLPEDLLTSVADEVERFAKATWDDLEARSDVQRRFLLSVFRGAFDQVPAH